MPPGDFLQDSRNFLSNFFPGQQCAQPEMTSTQYEALAGYWKAWGRFARKGSYIDEGMNMPVMFETFSTV